MISVIVPVGPNPIYKEYLGECLDSIRNQMGEGDEIVIIDDMANLQADQRWLNGWKPLTEQYIVNPWLLGCASSWNIGISRAKNEWCLLMGSDDRLLDGCIGTCIEKVSHKPDPLGFYNLTIQMSEDGSSNSAFNNAALVSKSLWRYTGGFPLSAGVGAPDALLISIMLRHMPEHLHQLREGHPLYWCRQHADQDTPKQAGFFNWECILIRDKETARFQPNPEWTQRL